MGGVEQRDGAARGPVLIAGATGFIGMFVAEAALDAGLITYILCRPPFNGVLRGTCDVVETRVAAVAALQSRGSVVVEGNIGDEDAIAKILREREVEVVISVVGGRGILDQLQLIKAIRAVPTLKRFLPSEFGNDVDLADPPEPGAKVYAEKRCVRRAAEAAGVPYTYICCNSVAGWPHIDSHRAAPPVDQLPIYGDGDTKAYFVAGCDIGKYTIQAAYDPRASRKRVHFRPACNLLSMNDLAAIWEAKIGKALPRVTVTAEDLVAAAAENRIPQSFVAAFTHAVFIAGCQLFDLPCRAGGDDERSADADVEISQLYPGAVFRTMEECFAEYLSVLPVDR